LKIQKILTDNGKEFTDRLFARRERQPRAVSLQLDSYPAALKKYAYRG